MIIWGAGVAAAGKVPDTGNNQCRDALGRLIPSPAEGTLYFGQDGSYHINPQGFRKLDSEGRLVSDAAVSWAMVQDTVTDLIWEVKTDDSSVHDVDNKYILSEVDGIIRQLNNDAFGAKNNWRLPTAKELVFIGDFGHSNKHNANFFGPFNTLNRFFWSSTSRNSNPLEKYVVDSFDTEWVINGGEFERAIRAVCGTESNSEFKENPDGTITDDSTGLIWQRDALQVGGEYKLVRMMKGVELCNNLGNDWRLPTIKELISIMDLTQSYPCLDLNFFSDGFFNSDELLHYGDHAVFWSSTIDPYAPTIAAMAVDFNSSNNMSVNYVDSYGFLRAVRGGYTGLADIKITVSDKVTNAVIQGASVSLETVATATDKTGIAVFNNVSGGGRYYIKIEAPGYVTHRTVMSLSETPKDVVLPVKLTRARGTGDPIVLSVNTPYDIGGTLYFIDGIGFDVTFSAIVDWGAKTQDQVLFNQNGTIQGDYADSIEYRTYNMGNISGGLAVTARSTDNTTSSPVNAGIQIVPPPPGFTADDLQLNDLGSGYTYTADITASGDQITKLFNGTVPVPAGIPVFGNNPLAANAIVNLAVTVGADGIAEYVFSVNTASSVAAAGVSTTAGASNWEVVGTARCRYGTGGWAFDAGEALHSNLSHPVAPSPWVGSVDVGEFNVPLVLTPSLQAVIDASNPITNLISGTTWDLSGTLNPEHAAYFAVGNRLSGPVTLETRLGMKAYMKFNFDASPVFQDAFAGVGGDVLATELFYQHRLSGWGSAWSRNNLVIPFSGVSTTTCAPIDRDSYANGGGTPFQSVSDASIYCQSDVYPYSSPALSADANLMVWVGDDPGAADENRTALFYSVRAGSGWSVPARVSDLTDYTGPDFNPYIVSTGDGDAALVWQHADDEWGSDLDDLRNAQEIWFAGYQDGWSDPVRLSDNATYDHSPVVASSGEGRMAVWINEDNGTQSMMYAVRESGGWGPDPAPDPAIQAFTPEGMVTFLALAYDATAATYKMVYSVDGDGNSATLRDQELYTRSYAATAGWAASTRLTENSTQDTRPWLVKDSSQVLWLFWYANGEILAKNLAMVSPARAAAPGVSAGGADFTVVPNGLNFHVLWSKPSATGQEITGVLYKPGQAVPSPVMLTSGGGVKRSLTGAMGSGGNLIIAYNYAGITPGRDLIDGSAYALTVPVAGPTSLCTSFYPLQKKLMLTIGAGSGSFKIITPPPIAQNGDTRYYNAGTSVTITPDDVLSDGWYFHHWTGDIGDVDPTTKPLSIVMNDDKQIQAVFEKLNKLTVPITGSGTVTLTPAGGFYEPGTEVTLTAQPGTGYMFDAWYGDAVGTQTPVTITMDGDKTVTANFILQYVLTRQVSPAGSGNIYVNTEGPYQRNAVVSLTAVPAAGYAFDHWGGPVTSTTKNPTSVTMASNITVTAYFRVNTQYSLTLTRYGSGTVTATPTGPYAPGTQVTLRATPAAGYVFKGWGGDATGTVNPLTVTMNANKTISATFEQSITSWMLTVLPCTNGSISPGSGRQPAGAWVQMTANPAPGYKLSQWTGDMGGSQNPKSLLMDGNKTVGAEFVQITYATLSVNVSGNGTVSPGSGQYPLNSQVILTATPDSGYAFLGWEGDVPPDAGTSPVIAVTMSGNKTVTANFTGASSYSLTVIENGNGTVEIDPAGPDYTPGTPVTLTAIPDPGNFFDGWGGSLTGTGNPATITMNSNKTVTAGFQAFVRVLYYPHVECRNTWDTEICAINTGDSDINGEFTAYDESGVKVGSFDALLPSFGRREINVGTAFTNPDDIRYIIFNATEATDALAGYTKFYRTGLYRAALPAVSEVNSGIINVPHIASNNNWWTGIALLNTSGIDRNRVKLQFNTGETKTVILPAGSYQSFTISELFDGADCSDLLSAVIVNARGVIGLELFGHNKSAILTGLPLTDETVTELYYPHVTSDNWWTGLVAFNPDVAACDITIRPYKADGTALATVPLSIAAGAKYVGTFGVDLDLPENTDWFFLEASHGITGFELFGQSSQMDGFSANQIVHDAGVFCKLASGGTAWTGISIVNTSDTPANVTFQAMDDSGGKIDNVSIDFDPHEKWVGLPEDMFDGDITAATYLVYSSDVPVAAFQLNGEGSGTSKILDGLPAMGITIASPNQMPVAFPDTEEVTNGDDFIPVVKNVLANDSDPDGDPLEITTITSEYAWDGGTPFDSGTPTTTQSGCFTIRTDKKTIVFDLGEDYQYDTGTATCTYTISDGKGGTAVSTWTVTVEAEQSTPF